MFRVKGTLSNGKGFKLEVNQPTLNLAVGEVTEKIGKIPAGPDNKKPEITAVSFASRGTPSTELELVDVPKRERKKAAAAAPATSAPATAAAGGNRTATARR